MLRRLTSVCQSWDKLSTFKKPPLFKCGSSLVGLLSQDVEAIVDRPGRSDGYQVHRWITMPQTTPLERPPFLSNLNVCLMSFIEPKYLTDGEKAHNSGRGGRASSQNTSTPLDADIVLAPV